MTTFKGGDAFNVIPETVTLGGTFRALSSKSFATLKRRIQEVCNLFFGLGFALLFVSRL